MLTTNICTYTLSNKVSVINYKQNSKINITCLYTPNQTLWYFMMLAEQTVLLFLSALLYCIQKLHTKF